MVTYHFGNQERQPYGWEQGWVHSVDKTEEVAIHIFSWHNKTADSWAEADGRTESRHKESGV